MVPGTNTVRSSRSKEIIERDKVRHRVTAAVTGSTSATQRPQFPVRPTNHCRGHTPGPHLDDDGVIYALRKGTVREETRVRDSFWAPSQAVRGIGTDGRFILGSPQEEGQQDLMRTICITACSHLIFVSYLLCLFRPPERYLVGGLDSRSRGLCACFSYRCERQKSSEVSLSGVQVRPHRLISLCFTDPLRT